MGYHVQFIAVRGKDPKEILDQLMLEGTGSFEEERDSPLVGGPLKNNWYLVHEMTSDSDVLYPRRFPKDDEPLFDGSNPAKFWGNDACLQLAAKAELIYCFVDEGVMQSLASFWSDGREIWRVNHDTWIGLNHLHAMGDLPPAFESIKDRQFKLQQTEGGADYLFDIPVELVLSITGFRYDDYNEAEEFEILKSNRPRKPWWQFWK